MGGGHVIFAFGGGEGFQGARSRNFSTSDGIEFALQHLDLLFNRDDAVELACRYVSEICHG